MEVERARPEFTVCYMLSQNPSPVLAVAIYVSASMDLTVYVRGRRLPDGEVKGMLVQNEVTLRYWSQFEKVLRLVTSDGSADAVTVNAKGLTTYIIHQLEGLLTMDLQEAGLRRSTVALVLDQMRLALMGSRPRYSANTLKFARQLRATSKAGYEVVSSAGFLLPSDRHFRSRASAFPIRSGIDIDVAHVAYLK